MRSKKAANQKQEKSGTRLPRSKARAAGTFRPLNDTAQRIIDLARAALMKRGYAHFSMRNVAKQARMRLNSVQYYFPTRADLVRALMFDTERRYREAHDRCMASVPNLGSKRFEAFLEFNLLNVLEAPTRRFFTQMWALLDTMDGANGQMLKEFYELDVNAICSHIRELDPGATPAQCRRRATKLAALIEGLVIVQAAHSTNKPEMDELLLSVRATGLQIALGKLES